MLVVSFLLTAVAVEMRALVSQLGTNLKIRNLLVFSESDSFEAYFGGMGGTLIHWKVIIANSYREWIIVFNS